MNRRPKIRMITGETPVIEVYDILVQNDDYNSAVWFCEMDCGCSGSSCDCGCEEKVTLVSPQRFKALVDKASSAKNLMIKINSDGGDYGTALEMLEVLREFPGEVTTRVVGVAASAASLILLAGSRREAAPGSIIMIHEPRKPFFGVFTRTELKKELAELEAAKDSVLALYSSKLKAGKKQIADWLEQETFFSAEEALHHGFVTAIVGGEEEPETTQLIHKQRLISQASPCQDTKNPKSPPEKSGETPDPYATIATRRRHLAGVNNATRSLP